MGTGMIVKMPSGSATHRAQPWEGAAAGKNTLVTACGMLSDLAPEKDGPVTCKRCRRAGAR